MSICAMCHEEYVGPSAVCTACGGTALGKKQKSSLRRFSLSVAFFLSWLGIPIALIAGVVFLADGQVLTALASIFISAPYCLAMTTVFQHVLDSTE